MSKIKVLDRFKNYKIINEIIRKKIENATDTCLVPLNDNTFLINNTIHLLKRIGSESSYGTVYISVINKHNKIKFITKIQLDTGDSVKEINILRMLTKYAYLHFNIHLPIMYNNVRCDFFDKKNKRLPENLFDKHYNVNSYNSLFIELACGDLQQFLIKQPTITTKVIDNILAQTFVSILTLHRLNIIHNDTHLGNFLYLKIYKGGCFKYIFKDIIFYIENIGLNWIISDYGLSKTITPSLNYKKYITKDYDTILTLIIEYLVKIEFDDINIIKSLSRFISKGLDSDYILFKILLKNELFISKQPIGQVITTITL